MMITRQEGPELLTWALGPPTTLNTRLSFPWKLYLRASVYQIPPLRGPRGTRGFFLERFLNARDDNCTSVTFAPHLQI